MSEITVPNGWSEVDTEFSQQRNAFQRRRDGLVVSIEESTTSNKFSVAFLPQNFYEDNQVIKSYGNDGYLYSGSSLEEAREQAKKWMKENPR